MHLRCKRHINNLQHPIVGRWTQSGSCTPLILGLVHFTALSASHSSVFDDQCSCCAHDFLIDHQFFELKLQFFLVLASYRNSYHVLF